MRGLVSGRRGLVVCLCASLMYFLTLCVCVIHVYFDIS